MKPSRPWIDSWCLCPLIAVVVIVCCWAASAGSGGDERAAVAAGQKAPAFQARTFDGKTVKFPDDYKGKVVMLDFWATWCGPCVKELPNVVAVYRQYHTNGLEILSVSLDRAQKGTEVAQFIAANHMTWTHIYDGGYWKTPVAVAYGVHAIPCPVIVDGSTGTVLAVGADAVGRRLPKVVASALAARAKK